MAKKNILSSVDVAMEGAALKEEIQKEAKVKAKKVTQKEGNHPICIKKFPKEWHDLISDFYPGDMSGYILLSVKRNLIADGLL